MLEDALVEGSRWTNLIKEIINYAGQRGLLHGLEPFHREELSQTEEWAECQQSSI